MAEQKPTDDIKKTLITTKNFFQFYRNLIGLRFPIPVADVLDLRYLINHSVDNYRQPDDLPDYRSFRNALRTAIHTFGIEKERYTVRLLNILAMLREIHYHHSIESRDAERKLRDAMKVNRDACIKSKFYGIYSLIATILSGLTWVLMSQPGWLIKLVTITTAYMAWDYLYSIKTLDKDIEILKQQLNKVVRDRVNSLDWKLMIHKLSMILGYKQIRGVEVFQIDQDTDGFDHVPIIQ